MMFLDTHVAPPDEVALSGFGGRAALSPLVHRASQAVHVLLYALLVLTPVVGVYLAFLRGDAVTLFGLFTIPSPVAVDRNGSSGQGQEAAEVVSTEVSPASQITGVATADIDTKKQPR